MGQQDVIDALIQLGAITKDKAVPLRTLAVYLQNRNVSDNLRRLRRWGDIKVCQKEGGHLFYWVLRGGA